MTTALMMAAFMIGARLGWESDWFRRLFRLGPYRRKSRVTDLSKD